MLVGVAPDALNRCQRITPLGQCNAMAMEGEQYCQAHGSSHKSRAIEFIKHNWYAEIGRFANNASFKDLKMEIGLLRLLVDRVLASCSNEQELRANQTQFIMLIREIRDTILAFDRIEASTGNLFDLTDLQNIATQLVQVISNEPSISQDNLISIATKIKDVFGNVVNETKVLV